MTRNSFVLPGAILCGIGLTLSMVYLFTENTEPKEARPPFEVEASTLFDAFISEADANQRNQDKSAQSGQNSRRLLLSQCLDRERDFVILTQMLEKAQKVDNRQGQFESPLHIYFQLIPNLHPRTSWSLDLQQRFLSMIDYTIDASTMPVGISVSGEFFYPAAEALVKIHANRDQVLNSMDVLNPADANYQKKLRLLLWVLWKNEDEDAEITVAILKIHAQRKGDHKKTYATAVSLLNAPHDILPVAFKVEGEKVIAQ